MRINLKIACLLVLSLVSTAKADSESCLQEGRFGNFDGREVVEINISREKLCTPTAY